jgi:hypothetical protein
VPRLLPVLDIPARGAFRSHSFRMLPFIAAALGTAIGVARTLARFFTGVRNVILSTNIDSIVYSPVIPPCTQPGGRRTVG